MNMSNEQNMEAQLNTSIGSINGEFVTNTSFVQVENNISSTGIYGNITFNYDIKIEDLCAGEYVILDPLISSTHNHLSVTFDFIVNGLGIIIVAILGIIGNILSAIVLSRPQMRSSVTCLLLALTLSDSLLISISSFIFGLTAVSDFTNSIKSYRYIYYPTLVPYLYPISITAQTASVYITLAVTIERYIAVCHPLRARSLCTWRRAKYGVGIVFIGSILYNLSRWFEVCTCTKGFDLALNKTVYENYMCPIRKDPIYINIYINWSYLLIMYLIPFTGLVVYNWAIYRQVSGSMVRKANKERQVLSKLQRREMGLATMLLFVVAVFLVCNILPLVNNILESFYHTGIDQLIQCSNFLVVFNSSVNFVIYCTCGERFRRLLFRLCRDFLSCKIGPRTDSMRNSVYRKSNYYRSQHGCEFEEVSLATMNTHSCVTNAGNNVNSENGSHLVNASKDKSNRRLNNCRKKTNPTSTGVGGQRNRYSQGNHQNSTIMLHPHNHTINHSSTEAEISGSL